MFKISELYAVLMKNDNYRDAFKENWTTSQLQTLCNCDVASIFSLFITIL